MSISDLLQWIESTRMGSIARETEYGFQILVGIHILGLALSVGTLVWFDLRLLGIGMAGCPISKLYRRLMPWFLTGFAVMFLSGSFLFAAFATIAYPSPYFRIKVAAILLAGINAMFFHRVTERNITNWDRDLQPPPGARMAGLISIVCWVSAILAGRMISYTIF